MGIMNAFGGTRCETEKVRIANTLSVASAPLTFIRVQSAGAGGALVATPIVMDDGAILRAEKIDT